VERLVGHAQDLLASVMTAGLKGVPCASRVSIISGEGKAMCERTMISVGRVGLGDRLAHRRFERVEVVGLLADVDDLPAVGAKRSSTSSW
jgi:hypothetical protein